MSSTATRCSIQIGLVALSLCASVAWGQAVGDREDGRRFYADVQEPRAGYEYLAERDKLLKGVFSFGLWTRDWMHVQYPSCPAVGNYEADFFEPWKWRP